MPIPHIYGVIFHGSMSLREDDKILEEVFLYNLILEDCRIPIFEKFNMPDEYDGAGSSTKYLFSNRNAFDELTNRLPSKIKDNIALRGDKLRLALCWDIMVKLHTNHISHDDFNLRNILIDSDENITIIDFELMSYY